MTDFYISIGILQENAPSIRCCRIQLSISFGTYDFKMVFISI